MLPSVLLALNFLIFFCRPSASMKHSFSFMRSAYRRFLLCYLFIRKYYKQIRDDWIVGQLVSSICKLQGISGIINRLFNIISTMTNTEISAIITQITRNTQFIQNFLRQTGYSNQEICQFFVQSVFASTTGMDPNKDVRVQLKTQIKAFLRSYQSGKDGTRIGLVTLLSRLEVEKGKIEQYGHLLNQTEDMASMRAHERGQLIKECLKKKPTHSAFMKHSEERSQPGQRNLKQSLFLQKERTQLLTKLQLFRSLMQCKNDDTSAKLTLFQRMLALESSG